MTTQRELIFRRCPGCGEQFPDHRRSVVWCSGDCRMLTKQADRSCGFCGEKNPGGIDAQLLSRITGVQDTTFRDAHLECRRRSLEEHGRVLQCDCPRCARQRGDEPARRTLPRTKDRDKRRNFGYRKHLVAILERDKGICQICNVPVDRTAAPNDPFYPHLDHVLKAVDGGADEPENLRLTHRWCNLERELIGIRLVSELEVGERFRARFASRIDELETPKRQDGDTPAGHV